MRSMATPLFAGPFYDTALRVADAHAGRSDREATAAWERALELGWQGVLIGEEHGGAGAEPADLAAIVEAFARRAIAVPLIDRCAVAPTLLAAAADQTQAKALLERVASAHASVAPALHAAAQHRSARTPVLDDDGMLHGCVLGTDWSLSATHVLFDARSAPGGSPALVLLDAAPLVARRRRYAGIDARVCADIDVEGLAVPPDRVLLRDAAAATAVQTAQQLASLLGCAGTVGACGAMIEQTIEYLNARVQFGVALSTFQSLRHRVVDMYVAYENARGLVREQLVRQAREPEPRQVALTRLYVQQVGRTLGEATIQLHGGMGMSQETLAARLALYAFEAGLQYGDSADCLDWLAADLAAQPLAA